MRRFSVLFLALTACPPKSTDTSPDPETDPAEGTDTDTDTEADSGVDPDTSVDPDPDTDTDTEAPQIDGTLRCAPASSSLSVTGAARTLQLAAELHTDSGVTPIPTPTWRVVDGPGTVSTSGLYTSPADHGGIARIQATYSGLSGVCQVEVSAVATANPSGQAGLPGAFAGSTPSSSEGCGARLLYPLDGSAMPGSFAPPEIQWAAGGANAFRLVLTSSLTELTVITQSTSFTPSAAQWAGLTRFDPGELVRVELTGGTWSGSALSGACRVPHPTDVDVADSRINGTIVYWAPPATKSLSFDANQAPVRANVALPGTLCHGCHTVNLNVPTRMTYGPDFPGRTNLVDLGQPGTVLQTWGDGFLTMRDYAAPDPTGTFVVISGVAGFQSSMALYRQDSSAVVRAISTTRSPTMPNWSPDGTRLVYAGCDGGASALGGANCDLYVQTWNPATQTFSGETRIADSPVGQTYYYPTFSPDSQWVAFNAAEQWTDSQGELQTSNANPKARLMLVAAGGGAVRTLAAANGTGDLMNSWPRWAPTTGDFAWLAFSTQRRYGFRTNGIAQLWVTGIDLAAAASGSPDPSRPPTWIPGQLLTEGNHTPTWLPKL